MRTGRRSCQAGRTSPAGWLAATAAALLLTAGAGPAAADPPIVDKVEPPSWWAGHSINPVRLLLRGRGLRARACGRPRHVDARRPAGQRRRHLPLPRRHDRAEARRAAAARAHDGRGTRRGEPRAVPPLPREGRFQGFGRRRDLPDHARPLRERRPGERRSRRARAGCSTAAKARYYHGGDLDGRHRRGCPTSRTLASPRSGSTPVYDNNDRLNERETLRRPADHGLPRLRRHRLLRGRRALRRPREAARAGGRRRTRTGIKVIQDQVANHTGPYHPWVTDPPTPTWFNGTAGAPPREHLADLDARRPARDARDARSATLDGWFIDILPDLNQDDPEVARYIIQNTLWWVGIERHRRHPPGHAALRAAPLLARLDGGDQARVPAAARRRRAVRRRPVARRPSSRAGARRFDGIDSRHRHAVRLPAATSRCGARSPRARPLREVAQMLGARPSVPRPGRRS